MQRIAVREADITALDVDAIAEITPTRAAQTIKRLQAARAASNPSNSTHTVTSGAVLRKFRRASLVPTAPTSGGVN